MKSQPAVTLTQVSIDKLNNSILGYIHDVDSSVNSGVVARINLDDWRIFWPQEIK